MIYAVVNQVTLQQNAGFLCSLLWVNWFVLFEGVKSYKFAVVVLLDQKLKSENKKIKQQRKKKTNERKKDRKQTDKQIFAALGDLLNQWFFCTRGSGKNKFL